MDREHYYRLRQLVVYSVVQRMKVVTAIVILLASSASATADEPSDPWKVELDVYLWGASIGGHTASGSDLDVSFGDLLKNLQMGFMGNVMARKGKWAMFADLIYLDVSKTTTSEEYQPIYMGQPIDTSTKLELTGWISTFGGAYSLTNDAQNSLDLMLGARYLNLDVKLSFDVDEENLKFDLGGVTWDGIIGLYGKTYLSNKWYLRYYGDVGTGDSDFTWQAGAIFGYKLNKFDLIFGYRYLDWNFDSKAALEDLNFHGPSAGVRFTF